MRVLVVQRPTSYVAYWYSGSNVAEVLQESGNADWLRESPTVSGELEFLADPYAAWASVPAMSYVLDAGVRHVQTPEAFEAGYQRV